MLIQQFHVPSDELTDVGLCEIKMTRLGRFVALAGRNGAGKSRILNKLEFFVGTRQNSLSELGSIQNEIRELEKAIGSYPSHEGIPNWKTRLSEQKRRLANATERITPLDASAGLKAVPFVPKNLALQDPRQHAAKELLTRFKKAKSPGLIGAEGNCLFYVQQLQNRWWNASHQNYSGTSSERESAINAYASFQNITERLLGTKLGRNVDGEPIFFGKPVADAGLSDGQKVILQLCVALHAQHSELDNSVFLLDEPENHLHPSAAIELLTSLYQATAKSQIWIATHSIPLLAYVASVDPMSLWYVEDGAVSNAGRHPGKVLGSLLGNDERIGQLHAFTGLPAQLAAINYATDSLFPPSVVGGGENDPQVTQIQRILISKSAPESPISVLDFGAGKGRLLDGLAAAATSGGSILAARLSYFAYDPETRNRETCQQSIDTHFPETERRLFSSRDEFFGSKEDECIDVVVMCNVLHEISPREWLDLFSSYSIVRRSLKTTGYLLLVEDQRVPIGEQAHEYGFIVLDTSHLRTLFCVSDQDIRAGLFAFDDSRGDGRLKAHLIGKPLLERMTHETIRTAIEQMRETAKDNIRRLRTEAPSYTNGQLHGFWTQQFANASLFLNDA